MPKGKVITQGDACPRCLKKWNKRRVFPVDQMAAHYADKHPKILLPDKYYKGPRSNYGERIAPYSGRFPVGTRVKLIGFVEPLRPCQEKLLKGPRKGQVCGADRPTPERMEKHYRKKHPGQTRPFIRYFQFYTEFNDHLEDVIGHKATVWDVTPAGYGGAKTPAVLHVRLDDPIDIISSGRSKEVYYSMKSMSVEEKEVVKLVKKK